MGGAGPGIRGISAGKVTARCRRTSRALLLAALLLAGGWGQGALAEESLSEDDHRAIRAAVEELFPQVSVARVAAPTLPAPMEIDVRARAEVDLESHDHAGRVERFQRLRCEARISTGAWRCEDRSLREWVRLHPPGEPDAELCSEPTTFELPIFLSSAEILDLVGFVQSGGLNELLPEHEPPVEPGEACAIAWIEPWPDEKYDIYTRRGERLSAGRLFEVRRECREKGNPCRMSLVRAISWGTAVPSF